MASPRLTDSSDSFQLLRPIRSWAVSSRAPHVPAMATRGLLGLPSSARTSALKGASETRDDRLAIVAFLSASGHMATIFDFLGAADLFRHRCWSRGMKKSIERLPCFLRCEKTENAAVAQLLHLQSITSSKKKLFPVVGLRGLDMTSVNEHVAVQHLAPAMASGCAENLVSLRLQFMSTEGVVGPFTVFEALSSRPPPRLKVLNLSGGVLADDGVAALSGMFEKGHFSSLQHLGLSQVACRTPGARKLAIALSAQPGCKCKLRSLDLRSNHMEDAGAVELFKRLKAPALKHLKHFRVGPNELTSVSTLELCKALKANTSCSRWRTLDLSHNPGIGDVGTSAVFAALEVSPLLKLKEVTMSDVGCGDLSITALVQCLQAGSLSSVTIIDFSSNEIRRDGFGFLAKAVDQKTCPHLETLNLSSNLAGDEGIALLSNALQLGGFARLTSLDVSYNGAARAMSHLAAAVQRNACPRLCDLGVVGNAPPYIKATTLFRGIARVR